MWLDNQVHKGCQHILSIYYNPRYHSHLLAAHIQQVRFRSIEGHSGRPRMVRATDLCTSPLQKHRSPPLPFIYKAFSNLPDCYLPYLPYLLLWAATAPRHLHPHPHPQPFDITFPASLPPLSSRKPCTRPCLPASMRWPPRGPPPSPAGPPYPIPTPPPTRCQPNPNRHPHLLRQPRGGQVAPTGASAAALSTVNLMASTAERDRR